MSWEQLYLNHSPIHHQQPALTCTNRPMWRPDDYQAATSESVKGRKGIWTLKPAKKKKKCPKTILNKWKFHRNVLHMVVYLYREDEEGDRRCTWWGYTRALITRHRAVRPTHACRGGKERPCGKNFLGHISERNSQGLYFTQWWGQKTGSLSYLRHSPMPLLEGESEELGSL